MNPTHSKAPLALAAMFGIALAVPAFADNSFNLNYAAYYSGAIPVAAIITINPDGSVAITNPSGAAAYDGSDDSLIGVVNNGTTALTSLTLSGNYIFGFDGADGIDYYAGLPISAVDNSYSGYGGIDAYFTVVDANNGTVHFASPISANGGTDFFSLEENLAAVGAIQVKSTGTVPDAASTLSLLGGALLALGAFRRKLGFAA